MPNLYQINLLKIVLILLLFVQLVACDSESEPAPERKKAPIVNPGPGQGNKPPVADAGPDQVVGEASFVNLSGANSSDPDGGSLTYAWTQTAGTSVILSGETVATPNFTAPSGVTVDEVLTFELTVSDGAASSRADAVNIVVTKPPQADAGLDQKVAVSGIVNLSGLNSSDPNGDALTYTWTQTAGTSVTLSSAISATPNFTAPSGITVDEVLTFELVVNDGVVSSAADAVNVVVTMPPLANAGPDQMAVQVSMVNLSGLNSSDPGGDTLTYAWTQTAGTSVALSSATVATPSFTTPNGITTDEVLTFELVVNDGAVSSAADTINIVVTKVFVAMEEIVNLWHLDETVETIFNNSASPVIAGSCVNCPAAVTGRINGALDFDGSNDKISVNVTSHFNWLGTESFSIEFWMNSLGCVGSEAIVGRYDARNGVEWWLGCSGGNAAFKLVDSNGNGSATVVTGTSNVADGNWHHIYAERDALDNTLRLYVDSVLENSINTTSYDGNFSATTEVAIGWLDTLAGIGAYGGRVDEIALNNRVLPENRIGQHYLDGAIGLRQGYQGCDGTSIRIMPLGDSITRGSGDASPIGGYRRTLNPMLTASGYPNNFVGSLSEGSGFDLNHEGHSGFSTDAIAAGLSGWLSTNPSDVVLLHIGTNGFLDSANVANILNIIDTFDSNITVVVARIINFSNPDAVITMFNDDVETMVNARIAAGDKLIMVDMEGALTYPVDMFDLEHPNAGGYDKMAQVWFGGLARFLPVCNNMAPVFVQDTTNVPLTVLGASISFDVDVVSFSAPFFTVTSGPTGLTINSEKGRVNWTPAMSGKFSVTIEMSNTTASSRETIKLPVYPGATFANIAALAGINGSSHNIKNGQLVNSAVDGVIDGWPTAPTAEWASNGEQAGAWLELTWPTTVTVDSVTLHDRILQSENVTSGTLSFSDGSVISVGMLNNGGGATTLSFAQKTITSLRFTIDSVSSTTINSGLAEIIVNGGKLM
ncbi:MAG: LamG-like jellyroll fold domain-containing protein [Thiohalomonadales bacterium]